MTELDALLGGGFTEGTTTVVLGPPGTGKSTLGGNSSTGSIPDRPAALFLFDEREASFVARCDALGMKMSESLKTGRVRIEQIDPGELSPGEFSCRVAQAVERDGARTVFIDSINGYLNAIPQSDTPLARMHELLSCLNERGVVT